MGLGKRTFSVAVLMLSTAAGVTKVIPMVTGTTAEAKTPAYGQITASAQAQSASEPLEMLDLAANAFTGTANPTPAAPQRYYAAPSAVAPAKAKGSLRGPIVGGAGLAVVVAGIVVNASMRRSRTEKRAAQAEAAQLAKPFGGIDFGPSKIQRVKSQETPWTPRQIK